MHYQSEKQSEQIPYIDADGIINCVLYPHVLSELNTQIPVRLQAGLWYHLPVLLLFPSLAQKQQKQFPYHYYAKYNSLSYWYLSLDQAYLETALQSDQLFLCNCLLGRIKDHIFLRALVLYFSFDGSKIPYCVFPIPS